MPADQLFLGQLLVLADSWLPTNTATWTQHCNTFHVIQRMLGLRRGWLVFLVEQRISQLLVDALQIFQSYPKQVHSEGNLMVVLLGKSG